MQTRRTGRLCRPIAAAALAFALGLASPAAAAPTDCPLDPSEPLRPGATAVDPGLIRDLILWIGDHTVYDVSALITEPPEVEFCGVGEHIPYGKVGEIIVEADLRATYDRAARRIFLILPWSADSPRDRAVLLHELVHWVQFRSASWPCPQAVEEQAYALQAAWLEEQGVIVDWDWFDIYLRSRCPWDVHP